MLGLGGFRVQDVEVWWVKGLGLRVEDLLLWV